MTILCEHLLLIALLCLFRITRAYIFFFSALSAEKKKILLCELCVSSEAPLGAGQAGGEKHALTYTHSIAEGLWK